MGGLIFAIIVSIGIPVGFFVYAIISKHMWSFVLGVVAFVGSQVLFRIPILQVLETNSVTYTMFSIKNPLLFSIVIGLSAGVAEELARFILLRFVIRSHSWQTGIFFGAGHGGIEAVLFVGIGSILMLFSFDGIWFGNEYFIGGIERLFAMIFHIGLSLLVLRTVIERRYLPLVVAIFLHGFVNSLVGIVPLYVAPELALIVIEVSLAFVAVGLLIYHVRLKRKGVFS